MSPLIQAVVADDSPFICSLLRSYLESDGDISVVGTAGDGREAVQQIRELRPDVLTLDLGMPGAGGLEALQEIMRVAPTPTVVISGLSGRAADLTRRALEIGAVDFVLKYDDSGPVQPEELKQEILTKVRAAARTGLDHSSSATALDEPPGGSPTRSDETSRSMETDGPPEPGPDGSLPVEYLVVIGASTGGPLATRELLGKLPGSLPAAVLVVQHIAPSFTGILARQLGNHLGRPVQEAEADHPLTPGTFLVAPGDHHLLLNRESRTVLRQGPKVQGHRPSIDVTMQSAARVYGPRAIGIVLTGMGVDGTVGLHAIRNRGGATFAQASASCVMRGMPQKAVDSGVVDRVGSPPEIAGWISKLISGGLTGPSQRSADGG